MLGIGSNAASPLRSASDEGDEIDRVAGDGGPGAAAGNRIVLLRDADGDGDGLPEVRTIFLDHLNAPFGVALAGGNLYGANTDAILRFPYADGATSITAPGIKLTDLPGGPIDAR